MENYLLDNALPLMVTDYVLNRQTMIDPSYHPRNRLVKYLSNFSAIRPTTIYTDVENYFINIISLKETTRRTVK